MEIEKYGCLVIDDEPIARKIIINYITGMPVLTVAAECINALTAIEYLKKHPASVDIIFIDINMPNLSGIELLKFVQPSQPIIFTTAYPEYAVESYDFHAVDYLLKPFSLERFIKAAHKAIDAVKTDRNKEIKDTLFIKADGKNHVIRTDEIIYCEAMKNYTMVILTDNRKLMPLVPLSKFQSMLAEVTEDFARVHRSFVISKKHLKAIASDKVTVDKFQIPVGENFKESFFTEMGLRPEIERQRKKKNA